MHTPPALVDILSVFQSSCTNLHSQPQWTRVPRCCRCFRDATLKMLITHPYTAHSPKFTERALPVLPTELAARESGQILAMLQDVLGTCDRAGIAGTAGQSCHHLKPADLPGEGLRKFLSWGWMLELRQHFAIWGVIPLVSQLGTRDSRGAEAQGSHENPSLGWSLLLSDA